MDTEEPQREQYTVGWICALSIEAAAARAMLDQRFQPLKSKNAKDSNAYILGRIGEHNVVIASLPMGAYGTTSAAVTATNMLSSFPNVRFGLLVGIGGGIPSEEHDIRLGDVVVSKPHGTFGGVVQFDLGKVTTTGFIRTGSLNRPPTILLTALATLEAEHILGSEKVPKYISEMHAKHPNMKRAARHLGFEVDRLYQPDYNHVDMSNSTCQDCSITRLVVRDPRDTIDPAIHYGLIASSNQVIKDSLTRDRLQKEYGALCFEMEAAGIMNDFPCLVIRGICDYSDSHKSKGWQQYSAATAAAYAKELLHSIQALQVEAGPRAVDLLQKLSDQTRQIHDQLKKSDRDRHVEKITTWLSPSDPSVNLNRALRGRHPSSGAWFMQSKGFRALRSPSSSKSSLWLHGLAGCGKTVLSASIIESLRQKSGENTGFDSSPIVLYFYFDFTDNQKQSLDNMAGSLVCQLYGHSRVSQEPLKELSRRCIDGREKPSTETLLSTFVNMLHKHLELTPDSASNVYIVIDALDECLAPRTELLEWLRDFMQTLPLGVHLLVTSRKETDIESKLTSVIEEVVAIQAGPINEDIRAYVHDRIQNDDEFEKWRRMEMIRREIEERLMDKADGMFRWAACQLDVLAECTTRPMIRRALESLPSDLNETYSRVLRSIPPMHLDNVTRILQLLMFSDRPLRLDEAVDAIAVDLNRRPCFDPEDRMPDRTDIVKSCSSLVVVVNTGSESEFGGAAVMQLAHFSVQQYLLSDKVESQWRGSLSKMNTQISNAKLCLAYCSHLKQAIGVLTTIEYFPFALYAAECWPKYAVEVEDYDEGLCWDIQDFFLRNKKAFAKWNCLNDLSTPLWHEPHDKDVVPEPLLLASAGGLTRSVKLLLRAHVDVNAIYLEDRTALRTACERGHPKIVQMLLDRGAKVDLIANRSELVDAISRGHLAIAEMLIEHGADLNAPDRDMTLWSPLGSAARARDGPLAELLQKNDTAYNNTGSGSSSSIRSKRGAALISASDGGHEKIVRLIVDRIVDMDSRLKGVGDALIAACNKGHESIVRTLLDNCSDDNIVAEEFESALVASCLEGHEPIVRMLFGKDLKFTAKAVGSEVALIAACEKGYERIVQIHLDNGADVNFPPIRIWLKAVVGVQWTMKARPALPIHWFKV